MKSHTVSHRLRAVRWMALGTVVMLIALGTTVSPALAYSTSEYWGGWTSLGTPPSGVYLGDPAVGRNLDGRVEVFARDVGATKEVWHAYQTVPNGAWTGWGTLPTLSSAGPVAT